MRNNTHKHHIIPKHMGGTNDPSNLVELTVEEHAEAHRKLYEEFGRWQDELAWKALSGQITNQDEIRKMISDANIGRKHTEEIKRIISEAHKDKPKSIEHRKKLSISAKIRANSPEGREHLISIAGNGKGREKGEQERKNISNALKSLPKTEEHKQALRKPKSIKLGWFTNGTDNLKLRLSDPVPEGYNRGRTFS